MIKKIIPVLVLAAFVAGPVAAPAFAAGDKKAAACEKIKDKAKKEECLKKAKMKK
jgi:Ni/Co efflux regulator RcnB